MAITTILGSASRRSGGLYHSVRRGVQGLVEQGWSVDVISLRDEFSEADSESWSPIRPRLFSHLGPPALGYSPAMYQALPRGGQAELVHQHGLWQAFSAQVALWRRRTDYPVVISPRGMLDPWALRNSYWKKRVAGLLFENKNLQSASCLHALNVAEAEAIRAFGLINPIAVIPNGVDLPDLTNPLIRPEWLPDDGLKTLVFIGRIHQKKGITELVLAWSILKRIAPQITSHWRLVIAGWDDGGHLGAVTSLIESLGLSNDILLPGAVFGTIKDRLLQVADGFVLPSYSEGLPMAILEAWAYEVPVFMTRACNLPEGFSAGAAIEIKIEPEAMASIFASRLDDSSLEEMGARGRALVSLNYTWRRVAQDYGKLYCWLQNGGRVPAFVER